VTFNTSPVCDFQLVWKKLIQRIETIELYFDIVDQYSKLITPNSTKDVSLPKTQDIEFMIP
jgi:hypothetical protein